MNAQDKADIRENISYLERELRALEAPVEQAMLEMADKCSFKSQMVFREMVSQAAKWRADEGARLRDDIAVLKRQLETGKWVPEEKNPLERLYDDRIAISRQVWEKLQQLIVQAKHRVDGAVEPDELVAGLADLHAVASESGLSVEVVS